MRDNVKSVALLLSALLGAGCSGAPAPKSDSGAKLMVGTPATLTAAAAPAAPASAAPATTAVTSPADDSAVDEKLVKEGYRVVKSKDGLRYCRTVVPTGTRFATTVCLTPEQVAQEKQSTRDTNDTMNRARAVNCKVISCGS
jgi:hypothetical protein